MRNALVRKLHSARIRWHRAHSAGLAWFGGEYKPIFEHKHLLTALLRGAGLPTVSDMALIRGERVDRLDAEAPGSAKDMTPREYLNGLAPGRYFVKPPVGEHGRDAGCLLRTEAGFEYNGAPIATAELAARGAAEGPGLLVQRWQPQHADLAALSADTLNTLRILTLSLHREPPRVVHAVLRLGRSGAWLDNFHAGGIALQVDPDTGRMVAPAVRLDQATRYSQHPDSGLELGGRPVSNFDAACRLAVRAHALFETIPSVGWDVAIGPDGPCIVEANLDWDAEIHAFTDPDFRRNLFAALRGSR